jgi:hypothetical protein
MNHAEISYADGRKVNFLSRHNGDGILDASTDILYR